MARAREFDVDDALDKALAVFWRKGFRGTSVQDLVDAMGIQRGSLYGTFGDKENLFQSAFDLYVDRRQKALDATREPVEAIQNWFNMLISSALDDPDRKGCFIVNSAFELEAHDEAFRKRLKQTLDGSEVFFRDRIREAQAQGAIPGHLDPVRQAKALLGAATAIRALSRARPEPALLHIIAETALNPLGISLKA
ncbi:MAG: TetR/AcrR family transcriptional regulator [Rhodospirillales bacterium]